MTAPVQVGPAPSGGGPVPLLTRQEVEYLERLARGESIQEIGEAWFYEASSARTFGERLRKKLGAKTNTQAVFLACQLKILDPTRRHGDHAGFAAHRYRDEEPCGECREGERAYRRELRAARRTRTS